MLSINNLSIHFSNRYLFDNVSFNVNDNDKIGLIGRNGTGKSTLLKIITGEMKPEEGRVVKPSEYKIGYLPQELKSDSVLPVYEEVKTALVELQQLETTIDELTEEMTVRTDYESEAYLNIIHLLDEANRRFLLLGGASIEAEIEKVMLGLGFEKEEFYKPMNKFSGGWQMRAELSKILLNRPDCILLDEPTNHLDIESIFWLENFLKHYEKAVILVSHDRRFLDNVTNRTIEIMNSKTVDMNCSYTQYIQKSEELREHQLSAYKNQKKQIEEAEKWIERFRYKATFASRVQSKIKQLDKIERIELEEDDGSAIRFKFPEAPRSGKLVAEAKHLTKAFGDKVVLNDIDFAIERGEKIAFIGRNGEGKSTLSKILAGIDLCTSGTYNLGYNIEVGYFAQHQAELLEGDMTVFDVIDDAAVGDMRTKVRSLLGAFLFSGETINKKVKVLSGGEKARLSLAKLLLQPVNLLILDEPTNHLDMASKDVLKNALIEYSGALILVSHDRSFLEGLSNKTYYFKKGKIKEYLGDIKYFLEKQNMDSLSKVELSDKKSGDKSNNSSQSKLDREERKKLSREENKIKKQIKNAEDEIQRIEARIAELEALFAVSAFFNDAVNVKKKQAEYDQLRLDLDLRMNEWTEFSDALANL